MNANIEPWLNLHEAAAHLHVSVDYMQEVISEIPGATRTKAGTGHWRVKASMLDSWFATMGKAEEG